jgi:hypothetical protein
MNALGWAPTTAVNAGLPEVVSLAEGLRCSTRRTLSRSQVRDVLARSNNMKMEGEWIGQASLKHVKGG